MNDFVTKDEFNGAINRIDRRVDNIERSSLEIGIHAKNMADTVVKIENILYGDGQSGILFVIKELATKVKTNRWLIGTLITMVVGLAGLIRLIS